MLRKLVIFGAGGFGRELRGLVDDINADRHTWDLLGFIDADPTVTGSEIDGLPVLGGADWLNGRESQVHVGLGIGSPAARSRIAQSLQRTGIRFPTLVHPSAIMSARVEMQAGVVVTAGNILTTNIVLGQHVLLNLACTVGHDVRLGDFVTVSPGANLSGNVKVGEGTDIGTGAKIIQGVSVGEWSVIGAGAVVTSDITANATVVGVPGRIIKERSAGWHLE